MSPFYQVVLQVTAVITVLILIGAAWALIRGSYNKARVQGLREDNDDLRKRLEDAESKIEAHRLKEEVMETKLQHQQTEIEMLTHLVTQKAEVSEVRVAVVDVLENLKDHHEEAKQYWTGINAALTALLSAQEGKS